jgi:hypothetical protein
MRESRKASDKLKNLKVSFSEFEDLEDEGIRMRYIIGLLENSLGSSLKSGVGRFESLLDCIGLGGGVSGDIRDTILEVANVRNVLVHRLGVADRKFAESCPNHPADEGDPVGVDHPTYNRYAKALYSYAREIRRRVLKAHADLTAERATPKTRATPSRRAKAKAKGGPVDQSDGAAAKD